MRFMLQVLAAWFVASIPVALLFGRLCHRHDPLAPETADALAQPGTGISVTTSD